MKEIGIIKEFDKLGRIVIPKELRERFALKNEVEIVATKDGIILKNPEYVLTKNKIDTHFNMCVFSCFLTQNNKQKHDKKTIVFKQISNLLLYYLNNNENLLTLP